MRSPSAFLSLASAGVAAMLAVPSAASAGHLTTDRSVYDVPPPQAAVVLAATKCVYRPARFYVGAYYYVRMVRQCA
jgi:hypothetical protein